MKILVTGGAGYVGSALIRKLAEDPSISRLVIYDNFYRSSHALVGKKLPGSERVELVEQDILDSYSLCSAMKSVDLVVHLAAKVTTPLFDHGPIEYEQINHWGTAQVVNAIEACNVPAAIMLSTATVYGNTSEEVDETAPVNPQSYYAISKANAESHFLRLSKSMRAIVYRCGNIFGLGANTRYDSVINRFAFDANFRNRVLIKGAGNQVRSFSNIDAVAEVIANTPSSNLASGVYNLVQSHWSIHEIVAALSDVFPDVEHIFVNRDISMKDLVVAPNQRVNALVKTSTCSLQDAFANFAEHFAF